MRTSLVPLLLAPIALASSLALAGPLPPLVRPASGAAVIAEVLTHLSGSPWEVTDGGCKFVGPAPVKIEGEDPAKYELSFDNRRITAKATKQGVELRCIKGDCMGLRTLSSSQSPQGRRLGLGTSRQVSTLTLPVPRERSATLVDAIDTNRAHCQNPPPPPPPPADPAVVDRMEDVLLYLNVINGVPGTWVGDPLSCELTLDVADPGEDFTFDAREVDASRDGGNVDVRCEGGERCIVGSRGTQNRTLRVYSGLFVQGYIVDGLEELEQTCETRLGAP